IFKDLKYSSRTSIELCRWAIAAGVAKRITFHSARHTHATLLLSHGVDIYTVSKLLGHKHVVSTERYAHITHKLKTEAVNTLSLFFATLSLTSHLRSRSGKSIEVGHNCGGWKEDMRIVT